MFFKELTSVKKSQRITYPTFNQKKSADVTVLEHGPSGMLQACFQQIDSGWSMAPPGSVLVSSVSTHRARWPSIHP